MDIAAVASSYGPGRKHLADARLDLPAAADYTRLPTIANDLRAGTLPDAKLVGQSLFQRYAFHLQVIGLLLLVGTVGVVVLSKREKEVN